ncbi:MAG: hypothetical protein IT473_07780 [Lysobacter sp.]|nr:hypothetical protein [Lysobacter sp.]
MKKPISRIHRNFLAYMFVLFATLGFAPQALSAAFIGSADLNGDGIPENIYSNGSYILVKNINGVVTGNYYIAPSWYSVAIADLDGVAGAEFAVRTYSDLYVLTHRTKKVFAYAVWPYGSNWVPMTVDQFDGVAGNEIAINTGSIAGGYGSILFISHKAHAIKQHFFSTGYAWLGMSVNDFDGAAGKEYAINTTSIGYLAVLHPKSLVPRYYYVGPNMQFLSAVNLDGVAGLEIRVRGYGGLVYKINDRKGTMTY